MIARSEARRRGESWRNMDITTENRVKKLKPAYLNDADFVEFLSISHKICIVPRILLISVAESTPDEQRSVWCRKRVVTFWEVKSTDMVAELKHTHWLSFTSRPQAFEFFTHNGQS